MSNPNTTPLTAKAGYCVVYGQSLRDAIKLVDVSSDDFVHWDERKLGIKPQAKRMTVRKRKAGPTHNTYCAGIAFLYFCFGRIIAHYELKCIVSVIGY